MLGDGRGGREGEAGLGVAGSPSLLALHTDRG